MNNGPEVKTSWAHEKKERSSVDKQIGVTDAVEIFRTWGNDNHRSTPRLNFFGFEGRISRLIFFYFFLFGVVINVIVRLWNPSTTFGLELIMGLVIIIGLIWITACAVVKRFHDLDQSGWNYWRLLIPLYNIYLLGLLLFKKGTAGMNTYGDDPIGYEE